MYDVIVIGGGHAGIEAALATARLHHKTLLIAGNFNRIANMPCNPSIGGPAKGILVREIDALGGEMAKAIDASMIQVKMLNSSKGPAVRALRAQADKVIYPLYMQRVLYQTPNLDLLEGYVQDILIDENTIKGIITENNRTIYTKTLIIASGTYLDASILCGKDKEPFGPDYEKPSVALSHTLKTIGFDMIRLKTGTPARIAKDSIDYTKTTPQYGDSIPWTFSNETVTGLSIEKQVPCYLTYTQPSTHELIKKNIHLSSMYSGIVTGVGPRYCPSIEDKIVRFADKERHQIFIEPESLYTDEMYVQGFSTSLPRDIQIDMIRSLPGLENAVIKKYAYAIEYDAINPLELKPTLETKKIQGLYFAGQVNGTSGYEEAACQGLMAGINAHLKLTIKQPFILRRDEAYTGVLIDDLVTKGVKDPYRLLTSRAEFRLLLRHDNAEARLLRYGYEIGLVSKNRFESYVKTENQKQALVDILHTTKLTPTQAINDYLVEHNKSPINEKISAYEMLRRPNIDFDDIIHLTNLKIDLTNLAQDELLIAIKYEGYIQKEFKNAQRMQAMENKKIPDDIDYDAIGNIALEARDKLKKVRPLTISQASRISGVNPSDISVLLVYIERWRRLGSI